MGIDIEKIESRIHKIAHKFVGEGENLTTNPSPKGEGNSLALTQMLYIIWGAKESLYKMYGKGELDFRENLFVQPFELKQSGEVKASIEKENFKKEFALQYGLKGEWEMVWVVD